MAYSSTYSSSTTSSTSSTTANQTTTDGETSSSSLSVDTTVQTKTQDGSDGLSATLGGEAAALGEDTLTVGSVSAEMEDGGAVTTLDGTATMTAASEDPDGGAQALTDTFADVSDGAEFVLVANVDKSSSEQNEGGSTATSTSTTNVTAYNLELATGGSSSGTTVEPVSEDAPPQQSNSEEEEASSSSDGNAGGDIEGNIAIVEFDASAVGEDTFVSVDAFALAVEDELSVSAAVVELGVG